MFVMLCYADCVGHVLLRALVRNRGFCSTHVSNVVFAGQLPTPLFIFKAPSKFEPCLRELQHLTSIGATKYNELLINKGDQG